MNCGTCGEELQYFANNFWVCNSSFCPWYKIQRRIFPPRTEHTVIETTPEGGKQSKLNVRCDLLPPLAALAISKVCKEGAEKYEDNSYDWVRNWHKIHWRDNLNHCMYHIFKFLTQDEEEKHLEHAMCRLMFSYEMYMKWIGNNREENNPNQSEPND